MQLYVLEEPFELEQGGLLHKLAIAYCTYGKLNAQQDNVIWICHALTASAKIEDWWPGMVGEGCLFDSSKYFIVCANIIGSCYGTTGPLSIDPQTSLPYFDQFPPITIRDMVKAHSLLSHHLEIKKIQLLAGGSMGGYQVLEWCVLEPQLINALFLIATSAKETAWGKAIHASQRMAIESDCTWNTKSADAASKGLKIARSIGMITYRNYETFTTTQEDKLIDLNASNRASSYINYQGEKFIKRFNAYSYWFLNHALDTHHLARGRNKTLEQVMSSLTQKCLVIGINSDILCPVKEQEFIANCMADAAFIAIDSIYGHDGFLVETAQIIQHVKEWMKKNIQV